MFWLEFRCTFGFSDDIFGIRKFSLLLSLILFAEIINNKFFIFEIEFEVLLFVCWIDISMPKCAKRTDREDRFTFDQFCLKVVCIILGRESSLVVFELRLSIVF
jgi:hypothetical protein